MKKKKILYCWFVLLDSGFITKESHIQIHIKCQVLKSPSVFGQCRVFAPSPGVKIAVGILFLKFLYICKRALRRVGTVVLRGCLSVAAYVSPFWMYVAGAAFKFRLRLHFEKVGSATIKKCHNFTALLYEYVLYNARMSLFWKLRDQICENQNKWPSVFHEFNFGVLKEQTKLCSEWVSVTGNWTPPSHIFCCSPTATYLLKGPVA